VHAWTSLLPTHPAKEALAAVDEAMKDVDRDEILAAETGNYNKPKKQSNEFLVANHCHYSHKGCPL
jgi:hypothetical protein